MGNLLKEEINITEETKGTRLDLVLSAGLEDYSRSFIQKLFEKGGISVNGVICTSKKYKCSAGDRVEITIPEPEKLEAEAEDIPINVVYEDEELIVVDKPAGMVVHPAPGNYSGTLVNALLYHCGDQLSSINGVIRPGIVHRIDKDGTGLSSTTISRKTKERWMNPSDGIRGTGSGMRSSKMACLDSRAPEMRSLITRCSRDSGSSRL